MRPLLSASAALCLIALSSCSSLDLTKGDVSNFKLRDLTRFGQPTIVKITPKELKMMDLTGPELAAVGAEQQRFLANNISGPIDFDPPTLPDAGVLYDGSILPPKEPGTSAVLKVEGSIPGDSQAPTADAGSFSIE